MTTLRDIIIHNPTSSQGAAVLLRDGLFNSEMVSNFSPTGSSVDVLKTLSKAVLPDASKDLRAMNWFGSYGSGKSHLATLIGQLLRDGAQNDAFLNFLDKLRNFGCEGLAETLKDSFSSDAKPYLIIPLYGSQAPSLAAKLMEGLFKSIEQLCDSEPELNIRDILPTTEYDVAIKRLGVILDSDPEYKTKPLKTWKLDQYFYDIDELEVSLRRHEPLALSTFCLWHKSVCLGAVFKPQNNGGQGFVEAYKEAAFNLKNKGYAGIAIMWDEFGNALEDLLRTSERNPVDEIIELQRFIEAVCEPNRGHVLFIGCTHVSMGEYGTRSSAGQDIQDRLKTIEGRFTPIKIELKASESEGYNLLSVQTRWTDKGQVMLDEAQPRLAKLQSVCGTLPLFKGLSSEILCMAKACYPLHPIAAAGLFSISTQYAQATRTAFTFFRDLGGDIWDTEIDNTGLFNSELVRIPVLIDYYKDSLQHSASGEFTKYRRAVAEVRAKGGEDAGYSDILTIVFLSVLLGENFQATDHFLAIALTDCLPENSSEVQEKLGWLQRAGLIWKNEMTSVWTLAGESGVEIEPLIEDKIQDISGDSPELLFANYAELRQDLFPILGDHNLAPSAHGIIRTFKVSIVTAPFDLNKFRLTATSASARVVLVLPTDLKMVHKLVEECQSTPPRDNIPIYYWISEVQPHDLAAKSKRYLSLANLLKEQTHGEGLKRQLKAKLDRTRHELISLINDNFGRQGLREGKTKIILSGNADPINCDSWHTFIKLMSNHVSSLFSEEVAVRSRTFNETGSESYIGSKKVTQLLQRILNIDENESYQNDLLGYTSTSQEAAIVDGLLGKYSNDLFIERESNFGLKKEDEVEGSVHKVLAMIRRTLTKRREKPYELLNLRKLLIGVPYGLPPNVHAIFTAIAIRTETNRLEWVGKGSGSFEEKLCKAFSENSSYRIRLQDFSRKQHKMLFILAEVLGTLNNQNVSEQEFLREIVHSLKTKIKGFPETILISPKLDGKARSLIASVEASRKTVHDIANDLIELSSFDQEWRNRQETSSFNNTKSTLNNIFDQLDELADARLYTIKKVLEELIPQELEERNVLFNKFKKHNDSKLSNVLELLKNGIPEDKKVEALVSLVMEKTYVDCSDIEIGQVTERLRALFEKEKSEPIVGLVPDPIAIIDDDIDSTKDDVIPVKDDVLDDISLKKDICGIVEKLQKVVEQEKEKYDEAIIIKAIARFFESSIVEN